MPTVFITGANRGIGLGLTKAYLNKGFEVIATCRHPGKAVELQRLKGKIDIRRLDVTDFKAIDALAKDLKGKPIDILINNAGVLGGEDFERAGAQQAFGSMDYKGLHQTLEVNTISPLKVSEAFYPNLKAGNEAKLITITSGMGSIGTTEGGYLSYRTSKAAVNAIMKNISVALRGEGITVAVLHPGWVRTDMGSQDAPVSVGDSVTGLTKVIDSLKISETGCFKNYLGETIPW